MSLSILSWDFYYFGPFGVALLGLEVTVVFVCVIGVVRWVTSDEWHQSFVATRTASVADLDIDTAGGILAQFIGALFYRYTRK